MCVYAYEYNNLLTTMEVEPRLNATILCPMCGIPYTPVLGNKCC